MVLLRVRDSRSRASDRATAVAKEARAAELEVDEVVAEGPAADVLIERAWGAALLVVGSGLARRQGVCSPAPSAWSARSTRRSRPRSSAETACTRASRGARDVRGEQDPPD
jgi:hypothetical protein